MEQLEGILIHWKNWHYLLKMNTHIFYDPVIPSPCINSAEVNVCTPKQMCQESIQWHFLIKLLLVKSILKTENFNVVI